MSAIVPKQYNFLMSHPDPAIQRMIIAEGHNIVNSLDQAHIVVFPGGADVCPMLYGERPLDCTRINLTRDLKETKLYRKARALPKIGICRGAQFLNVMAGGGMWQDVNNHTRTHDVFDTRTGEVFPVSSTHHQMMIPPPHARVLAWAGESTVKTCQEVTVRLKNEDGEPLGMGDPEVVFLKEEKSLCFQPHPEYTGFVPCRKYFWELVGLFVFTRVHIKRKG